MFIFEIEGFRYLEDHVYEEKILSGQEFNPTEVENLTCSTEFEQIARQLEFKHQSQIFKLLPMNYD